MCYPHSGRAAACPRAGHETPHRRDDATCTGNRCVGPHARCSGSRTSRQAPSSSTRPRPRERPRPSHNRRSVGCVSPQSSPKARDRAVERCAAQRWRLLLLLLPPPLLMPLPLLPLLLLLMLPPLLRRYCRCHRQCYGERRGFVWASRIHGGASSWSSSSPTRARLPALAPPPPAPQRRRLPRPRCRPASARGGPYSYWAQTLILSMYRFAMANRKLRQPPRVCRRLPRVGQATRRRGHVSPRSAVLRR
jgi:hypothetical protein